MIVTVDGKEVVKTTSSKIIDVDSKQEAAMFVEAYSNPKFGFTSVTAEAEYHGPNVKVKKAGAEENGEDEA